MARSRYGPSITYSGPFFEKDIKKTFRGNARNLVEAIAQDGESMVRSNLPKGPAAPHYADFVEGRARSLSGKKWALTAVVTGQLHLQSKNFKGYGAVLETTETFNRRSRSGSTYTIRGFGKWVYRRVANALKRGSRTARADLTKGLN
jgi:hypothetical protein